ncbi:type II toxin-antitoxin system VapC family toxin [Arcanobacterium canis]
MPNTPLPFIILDSCLYITYMRNDDNDLAGRVQALLEDNKTKHQIILPTIVYLEVLGVIRGKVKQVNEEMQAAVEEACQFFNKQQLLPAELDLYTARLATDLIPRFQLKGPDAAILATAQAWEARRLYTNDNDLLKIGQSVPGVSIMRPPESDKLPI